MLKETETEEIIGFVSRFLSLLAFQLKRGRALCPPLATRQKFMKNVVILLLSKYLVQLLSKWASNQISHNVS